jgi:hypothetical protein
MVVRGSLFTVHGLLFAVCCLLFAVCCLLLVVRAYTEAEKRNQTQGLVAAVYGSGWPVWGKLRAGWGGTDGIRLRQAYGATGLYGTHETYAGAGGARIIVFVSGLGANGGGLGRPDA